MALSLYKKSDREKISKRRLLKAKKMKGILGIVILLIGFSKYTSAQTCNPDSIEIRSIKANNTSPLINWEIQNHQVFINPACSSNGKLLLHLVGTFDTPSSTTFFPIQAANNGYKVISLKYPNRVSGTTACRTSADIDCHLKYRQEIVLGTDASSEVSVDSNNSIINRFEKLLIHLNDLYPSENWDDFLADSTGMNWASISVSGHSQGGGHAAFLAKNFFLNRVIMFASPNEYSSFYSAPASWINLPSATPDSNYYGFGNLYDDIVDFEEQVAVWNSMNLNTFADTVCVDSSSCNFSNSHMLYTKNTSGSGLAAFHNSVVLDDDTPISSGEPVFSPVWDYLLGLCEISTSVFPVYPTNITIKAYPNPATSKVKIESETTILRIEVINALGSSLGVYHITQNIVEIDTKSMKGLIFFKVYTSENRSKLVKLIIN